MTKLIKNYTPDKSVFIIDGHSMIYRAYYAFIRKPLINSKGFNTSGIFGFLRILFRLIKTFEPHYLVISFDTGKPNFRHTLYKNYKSTRKKMPDDLIPQIPILKEIIQSLGIKQIEMDGYESDDVIAKLARDISKEDINVYVITKDKDLLQLIQKNVFILQPDTTKGSDDFQLINQNNVNTIYDIPIDSFIDYFALAGDTSDNIPGVQGIGPKTALELIKQYRTIENLYHHIDEIKSIKVKEKLIKDKENAFLSKKLVTLSPDIPFQLKLNDLIIKEPDKSSIQNIFNNLEIKTLLKDLNWLDNLSKEKKYEIIDTKEKFEKFLLLFKKYNKFSFDTETDSPFPISTNLVGLSFSFEENSGYYIPVGHSNMLGIKQLSIPEIINDLKPIFENENFQVIGQNLKFDYLVMNNYNVKIEKIFFDTMLASYLINPTKTRHNLDELALNYLGYKTIKFEEVVGKKKSFAEVPTDLAANYSIEDADIALRLSHLLETKISELNLTDLYQKIDIPLIKVLATMELNGVKIDIKKLNTLDNIITKKLFDLSSEIYKQAGEVFNINSTKQLSSILFEKLKLNPLKKGKTGQSTDIEVLEELKAFHPIAGLLIDYRVLNKLKTTYIDTLPTMINTKTKRLHTSFGQTTTATGRLSSSDPNLQNIPIRDELGKQIREAFISEKDNLILSADYSQIELRILAHISQDEVLIDAFKKDEDIHTRTVMEIYNLSKDKITPELRRMAKIINYGIIYGMGAYGLSKAMGIGVNEAQEFINNYFNKYKGIKQYIENIKEEIDKKGYVENLFGRRRYLPSMSNYSKQQKAFVLRTAINTPIQGTAADLIKIAMIDIYHEMEKNKWQSKMLLQVHDELVFEVIPEEKEELKSLVKTKMENVYPFIIPIKVDINIGKNWGEAH